MKAILYGIGNYYKTHRHILPKDIEVIAFGDSSEEKSTALSGKTFDGKPVLCPKEIEKMAFDLIYICTDFPVSRIIFETLCSYKIPMEKIRLLCREEGLLSIKGDHLSWNYIVNTDNTILSNIGEISILEKGGTDTDVVVEVFGYGVYRIDIPPETIVIDAGMNIGAATLFFAGNDNVERVYGFEPFPDTYKQAEENIAINKDEIRNKILIFNEALFDKNTLMNVAVSTDNTAWRGIDVVGMDQGNSVEIKCRDSAEVIREIIDENPGKHFVFKLDVEGSELSIFKSIDKSGLFSEIDCICMEYHNIPSVLLEILHRYNFVCYTSGRHDIGTIIATKRK